MVAPLVCTKGEPRFVVCFLWAEGVQGAEIDMLCAQYGDSIVSQGSVHE